MSPRHLVGLTFLLSLLITSIALAQDREPTYQGKTLSIWIAALKDANPPARLEAARALEQIGRRAIPAIPELIALVKNKDASVELRNQAAAALGAMGVLAKTAVPALEEAAGAEGVEALACYALGRIGKNGAAALARLLKQHPREQGREAAAEQLEKLGSEASSVLDVLTGLLKSPADDDRARAILVLKSVGPAVRSAIPALSVALEDANGEVQAGASSALRNAGKDAVPVLAAALKHRKVEVRREAARALAFLGSQAAPALPALIAALPDPDEDFNDAVRHTLLLLEGSSLPALRQALTSPDAKVRRAAVRCLVLPTSINQDGFPHPRLNRFKACAPELLAILKKGDAELRVEVIGALGVIEADSTETLAAVRKLAADPAAEVRAAAISFLGVRGPKAATAVLLRDALQDKDPRGRQAAYLTLQTFGPEGRVAVPVLAKALARAEGDERGAIVVALYCLGPEAKEAVAALAAALKDDREPVRRLAAAALGRIGPPARAAVPALLVALEHPDEVLRAHAAEALGEIRPALAEVLPALRKRFQDADIHVPVRAVRTLGKLGPEAVPELRALLKHANISVQGTAAEMLGHLGPAATEAIPDLIEVLGTPRGHNDVKPALERLGIDALPALAKALNHPNAVIARFAAQALYPLGPKALPALPALIEALDQERDHVAANASPAIRHIGKEALPALRQALQHKSLRVRRHVALLLAGFGADGKVALPELLPLASHSDAPLRSAVVASLGAIGPEANQAVPALMKALKDPDREVRYQAVQALGKIGSAAKAAIPGLLEALNDAYEYVPLAVPTALHGIGAAGLPGLMECLRHRNPQVCSVAAGALVGCGPDAQPGAERLAELARGDRDYTRERALDALLDIGPGGAAALRSVVPALTGDLRDNEAQVRHAALKWLGRIGAPARAGIPAVAELAEDGVAETRTRALVALVRLDREKAGRWLTQLADLLRDGDDNWALEAAQALEELGEPGKDAVPALVVALDRPKVGEKALSTLARLGPAARAAVPALLKLIRDDRGHLDPDTVRETLQAIDPEAARKAKGPGQP